MMLLFLTICQFSKTAASIQKLTKIEMRERLFAAQNILILMKM